MRLIDADQMLADEKEAYYAARQKIDDITLWRANYLVHHKIKKLIDDTPTINAVPVVRCKDCRNRERKSAEWIKDDYEFYHCSNCLYEWDESEYKTQFCPQCGAVMHANCSVR